MKRTNGNLKIKWNNIALAIVLVMCASIIIHDLFMVTVYSWVKGINCGWTWFGLLTFLLAIAVGGGISEYFIDEFNK